jgi:hypothetical protein
MKIPVDRSIGSPAIVGKSPGVVTVGLSPEALSRVS